MIIFIHTEFWYFKATKCQLHQCWSQQEKKRCSIVSAEKLHELRARCIRRTMKNLSAFASRTRKMLYSKREKSSAMRHPVCCLARLKCEFTGTENVKIDVTGRIILHLIPSAVPFSLRLCTLQFYIIHPLIIRLAHVDVGMWFVDVFITAALIAASVTTTIPATANVKEKIIISHTAFRFMYIK